MISGFQSSTHFVDIPGVSETELNEIVKKNPELKKNVDEPLIQL